MNKQPASSFRLRFLLAVSLWVVLGIGAIWISAVEIFRTHVEESYHEELEVHVRELGRLAVFRKDGSITLARPLSDPRYEEPLSGFYWQITSDGHPALRSASMTRGNLDETIAHSPEILHKLDNGPSGPAITYGFTRRGEDGRDIHFVIATDHRELDRLIRKFTRDLTVTLIALGLLLLATGFAIISFGLHPLDRLSAAIGRLRRGEVQQLEGDYPAEINPLISDLNAYIAQNAKMVAKARAQAGNLAHSLRTPLAIITDEAERMANQPGHEASAKVLLDHTRAIEQQIEFQLARARSSSGQPYAVRRVVVPDVAMPILRAMERLHPDKTFELRVIDLQSTELALDAVDFAELLSILLDNAAKWARQTVTLTFAHADDGTVITSIQDDGPGIKLENLSAAFEIGSRFDPAMPGSGLGLPIARDLAENLGLDLQLQNLSQGLLATIQSKAKRPAICND